MAAAVLVDAVARLQEGALNDAESAAQDSFEGVDGLLDCPHYTHPASHAWAKCPRCCVRQSCRHRPLAPPAVLGPHLAAAAELLDEAGLSKADRTLLEAFRREIGENGA